MQNKKSSKVNSTDVAAHLRGKILAGELSRESRLPVERELAEEFNIARGTARNAIKKLADEGLVEIRAGSGSYVVYERTEVAHAIIADATPMELIDVRLALEPHSCRLAVLNAKRQHFDNLEKLLVQMEDSIHDVGLFSELDSQFHAQIAESTGNSLIIWVVAQVNSVRNHAQWSMMRSLTLNDTTMKIYNRQHRQIFDAIAAREPEKAAQLMKEHLQTARATLNDAASA